MARIRTVKPKFYRHELLQDLEIAHGELRPMLVFSGLWGHCDKNGVFEWQPRQLKLDILPFLPFDMAATLALLVANGLVLRFTSGGKEYGHVPSFKEHQSITGKEGTSPATYPEPTETIRGQDGDKTGKDGDAPEQQEGKEEGKGIGKEERLLSPAVPAGDLPDICPHGEIVALYHRMLPSLTQVRDWTPARQALLRARWRESEERQDLTWWGKFFGYVAQSDFLMGRSQPGKDRDPFECDLEWLVKPRNFVKVLEGKYENRKAGAR